MHFGKNHLCRPPWTHTLLTNPCNLTHKSFSSSWGTLSDAAEPPFVLRKFSAAGADQTADPQLPVAGSHKYCFDWCCLITLNGECFNMWQPYWAPKWWHCCTSNRPYILGTEAPALITVINMPAVSQPKNDSQHGSVPGNKLHFSKKYERNQWMFHESLPHICPAGLDSETLLPSQRTGLSQFITANHEASAGCHGNSAAAASSTDASRHWLMRYLCFSRYHTLMRGTCGTVDFFIIYTVFILQSSIKKMDLTIFKVEISS